MVMTVMLVRPENIGLVMRRTHRPAPTAQRGSTRATQARRRVFPVSLVNFKTKQDRPNAIYACRDSSQMGYSVTPAWTVFQGMMQTNLARLRVNHVVLENTVILGVRVLARTVHKDIFRIYVEKEIVQNAKRAKWPWKKEAQYV